MIIALCLLEKKPSTDNNSVFQTTHDYTKGFLQGELEDTFLQWLLVDVLVKSD